MEVLETLAAGQITVKQAEELLCQGIHSEEPGQENDELAVDTGSRGKGEATLDQLVAMRIHGVDRQFMQQMRDLGLSDLSLDKLVAMRIRGVSGGFVREMASEGLTDLTAD